MEIILNFDKGRCGWPSKGSRKARVSKGDWHGVGKCQVSYLLWALRARSLFSISTQLCLSMWEAHSQHPQGSRNRRLKRSCLKDSSMEPITYDLLRKYPVSFYHMIMLLGQKWPFGLEVERQMKSIFLTVTSSVRKFSRKICNEPNGVKAKGNFIWQLYPSLLVLPIWPHLACSPLRFTALRWSQTAAGGSWDAWTQKSMTLILWWVHATGRWNRWLCWHTG